MNLVRGIVAVVRFQLGRSFTAARLLWWFVLVLFPPLVVGLTFLDVHGSEERKTILEQVQLQEVFVLVPNVACMLGVFLWTSTVLQSEIENRSWVYLAVRPRARMAHIVGSYLVAVVWTITAALMALLICMFEITIPSEARSTFVMSQVLLILVSATSYASIYLLIGVLFYQIGRAHV